jgi:hypothetical protein
MRGPHEMQGVAPLGYLPEEKSHLMFFLEFIGNFAALVVDDDVRDVLLAQAARIQHLNEFIEEEDSTGQIATLREELESESALADRLCDYEAKNEELETLLSAVGVESLSEVGGEFRRKYEREIPEMQQRIDTHHETAIKLGRGLDTAERKLRVAKNDLRTKSIELELANAEVARIQALHGIGDDDSTFDRFGGL